MEAGVMSMASKQDLLNKFSHKYYVMLRKNSPEEADKYIANFQNINGSNFQVNIDGEEVTTQVVEQEKNEDEVQDEQQEKEELVAKLKANGHKLASTKWGIETLRKKVAELS